jgi:hypothetical protein
LRAPSQREWHCADRGTNQRPALLKKQHQQQLCAAGTPAPFPRDYSLSTASKQTKKIAHAKKIEKI